MIQSKKQEVCTVNKTVTYLKKLFLSGGLSEEAYERIAPNIRKNNTDTWRVISPLCTIYFAVVFLSSFEFSSIALNAVVYFVMMIISGVCCLLLNFILGEDSPLLMPLIYLMNGALLLFAIAIGVVISPAYLSVTYMVLLVALPLITIDRPWRMVLLLLAASLIFCLACVQYKDGDLREIELFNLCCFSVIALLITTRMTALRLMSYVWQNTVEEDSLTDALTRVKNTTAYNRLKVTIDQKIQNNEAEPFSIVICDVNYLKMVNDNHGHEKGDVYLIKNCQKICQIFRHSPVYRIGGDEFLVYLTGQDYASRSELIRLAKSACNKQSFGVPEYDRLNFAIGLADYIPGSQERFVDLFHRADADMYECKKIMHGDMLPLAEDIVPHTAEPQSHTPEALKTAKHTILVIEDNEINREMLSTLLDDRYRVITAENGRDGLDLLAAHCDEISMILLDIIMPVMDGYDFLDAIRRDPLFNRIPVIVTSGNPDENTEEKCMSLGASDFVSKPYNPNVLLSRIANLISFQESSATLSAIEYDSLTGLYTLQAFYHYAAQLLSANPDRAYDLCISDIDDFRSINDNFGEATGDLLIRKQADFLKNNCPPEVLLGRYSGDRFVAFFPHEIRLDATEISRHLSNFNQDLPFPGLVVNTKLGIYQNVDHALPVSQICDRALAALRTVKHQYGKDCAIYDASTRKEQERKFQIEQSMQDAYNEKQFRVYYQPKHDTQTGKLVGAEALIRWVHPVYGFMSPAAFIPVFEKNGFIAMADYYVWNRTCENLKRWKEAGISVVPISVNSSRMDFDYPNYLSIIRRPVERAGLEPSLLHIEITESLFSEDLSRISTELQECRDAGFKIEMDDFGTGYSSLNALAFLPLDIVKLDMSLMTELHAEKKAQVLSASIMLAQKLGLKTIAEGVETEEQLDLLRKLNCNSIQGYYFSKPLPEEEFEAYMRAHAEA